MLLEHENHPAIQNETEQDAVIRHLERYLSWLGSTTNGIAFT